MLARVQPPGASWGGNGGICVKTRPFLIHWALVAATGAAVLCSTIPTVARDIPTKSAQEHQVYEWISERFLYKPVDGSPWYIFDMVEVCTRQLVYGVSDQNPDKPEVWLNNYAKRFLVVCAADKGFRLKPGVRLDDM